MITAAQLKAIAGGNPRADMVAAIVAGWPNAIAKAGLTTRLRAAHFLAQIMTETGGLTILEESGAYRAERILEIFGAGHHSARVTPAEAQRIAALPVAQRGPVLFNRVYGTGNPTKMHEFDNTGPNDGWLYRGGGMMQCTGKSNYAAMAKKTGLPLVAHPELLHSPGSAFTAAYLEWAQDGRCNEAADHDDVATVRRIVNGGKNGLAACKVYLARATKVLAAYTVDPPPATFLPQEDDLAEAATDDALDRTPMPAPSTVDGGDHEARPLAIDPDTVGDPELFAVQKRLKGRHYSPGVLDGKWGSGISGALSGFANDRHMAIGQPTSIEEFRGVQEQVKAELTWCEENNWFRPVTAERANADPGTVATVAPEVVPAKRSYLATLWGSIVAFFTALYQKFSDNISQGWDFVMGHKDDLGDSSSWLSYLHQVPTFVWFLAIGGVLLWVALEARDGVNKITTSVQTGARQ